MENSIRKPIVAGMFYPANRDELSQLIEKIDSSIKEKIDLNLFDNNIIGGVLPHAGYIYSAYHAIPFFQIVRDSGQEVDTVIILNPNHRGHGPSIALDRHSFWQTPFGNIAVDFDFYDLLDFPISVEAHYEEHSAEVMVPLIQHYLKDGIKILPISIKNQSYEIARGLAKRLANAIEKLGKQPIIIASSDFSHFESPSEGERLDDLVMDKIFSMDVKGVYNTVVDNGISVCGYGPIMALMEYSLITSPNVKLQLLSRGHSGEVSPSTSVVDYISILYSKPK